jgi:hypothetical protein
MPTMRAVVRKPRILVFAAMGCWLMLPAAAIEIPEGTHLLLRMVNTVSTKTSQPGDYVYMRTASPISVDGRTVVPVNSYVQGVVTHTKRSGKVSGRAQLGIRLETLTLRRGKVLKISPLLSSVDSNQSRQRVDREENLVRQGPDHGRDAARIVILAGSGASIGGIVDRGWKGAGVGAGIGGAVGLATVMLSRGREVQLRQGTAIDVVFERAVTLE